MTGEQEMSECVENVQDGRCKYVMMAVQSRDTLTEHLSHTHCEHLSLFD